MTPFKNFKRFDEIADGNIVLVFSFLNTQELLNASLMSSRMLKLSIFNDLWLPLCIGWWQNHYRVQEWIERAELERKGNCTEVSNNETLKVTFWKEQFLHTKKSTVYDVGIFAMGSIRAQIGSPFQLHFFEPRYRLLAARCQEQEESKRFVCFSSHIPQPNGMGMICRVTFLHIFPDGRADITLLPVIFCKIENTWFEEVPGAPYAPKLYCGKVREVSMEAAAALGGAGRSHAGNGGLYLKEARPLSSIFIYIVVLVAILFMLFDK